MEGASLLEFKVLFIEKAITLIILKYHEAHNIYTIILPFPL